MAVQGPRRLAAGSPARRLAPPGTPLAQPYGPAFTGLQPRSVPFPPGCSLSLVFIEFLQVYGQGSGLDCRRHVQKLNLLQGEAEEASGWRSR